MKATRFYLHFFAALAIVMTLFFTWHAYREVRDSRSAQGELFRGEQFALKIIEVKSESRFRMETFRELQLLQKEFLRDSDRSRLLAEVVKAYAAHDADLVRAKSDVLLRAEANAEVQIQNKMDRKLKKAEVDAAVAIGTMTASFVLLILFVNLRILRPIQKLSRRMLDFLNDRYSFNFHQVERGVLGTLDRNFKALAERSINNVDEMRSLDQAKSDFLNMASHELRTPLTSIKGSLSLLSSPVLGEHDESSKRLIKIAESETDRLIRLINDLLDLAKIESQKIPLEQTWFTLDEMILSTGDAMDGLAHHANVNIEFDVPAGVIVFMDCDRIQQVLINLLSNAVKVTPVGGTVRVTASRSRNGELALSVLDQGPGLSSEDQKSIFEKFIQLPNQNEAVLKGTGLGLTIAKILVEQHNGRIGVESELGHGSCFWFTLPRWREVELTLESKSERRMERAA